jgi:hypothetical protein
VLIASPSRLSLAAFPLGQLRGCAPTYSGKFPAPSGGGANGGAAIANSKPIPHPPRLPALPNSKAFPHPPIPRPTRGKSGPGGGGHEVAGETGTTPEQSKVNGAMRETIQDGLKYLSDGYLEAIAEYLFAQPAIVHDVAPKR